MSAGVSVEPILFSSAAEIPTQAVSSERQAAIIASICNRRIAHKDFPLRTPPN
jgi:hypothetical protein